MSIGVLIITDEKGNIVEEHKLIITDGATTVVRKADHFEYGWTLQERR